MNKFKARKENSTDDRREDRDTDRPNELHKNTSNRRQDEQDEQRNAQPKQKEPEYKPKHGKKLPAILLAGVAAFGAYQIGTHGGFEKTLHPELLCFIIIDYYCSFRAELQNLLLKNVYVAIAFRYGY